MIDAMPLLLATAALGTRVELVLDGPETPGLRAVGEEAIAEVHHWHERLSFFQPGSHLSFINREAGARAVPLDEDLWGLLSLCRGVHRDSGGAFDPALAGSGPELDAGWASAVALDDERRTVRFLAPRTRLDLGAVAKGFALDRAADLLRQRGVDNVVLHAGTSTVIALGATPRTIGVRSAGGVVTILLQEECLSVSAPRGRMVEGAAHILRRGGSSLADTALVVGPVGAGAASDAWSTALVVLGSRPASMPDTLRTAVHDGRRWTEHDIQLTPAPEAA